jgi:hypothetical protein
VVHLGGRIRPWSFTKLISDLQFVLLVFDFRWLASGRDDVTGMLFCR